MDYALRTLIAFWVLTIIALGAFCFAVATGRIKLNEILTPREWLTLAQLIGIIVLTLTIIYSSIGARYAGYAAQQFIYGHF